MFKSWLKISSILILILLLTVGYFRHRLCKICIEKAANKATGLNLSIDGLNLDILNNSLSMQGITIFNPPEFKNEILAKIKQVFIKYDLLGFLTGKLHLRLAKVDIDEINIIINKEGRSNVSVFKKEGAKGKPSRNSSANLLTQKKDEKKKQKRSKFLIDRLELSSVKITHINYQARVGQTAVTSFKAEHSYVTNVTNFADVLNSVSVKGDFRNVLNKVVGMPQDILNTTTGKIKSAVDDILPISK